MLPLVLETIVVEIGQRLKNSEPFTWVTDQPTDDDIEHILEQGGVSEFDTLGLRSSMIQDYRDGKATIVCKSGPYAKVLAIVHPDTVIPWDSFAAIFQAFGQAKRLGHEPKPRSGQTDQAKRLGQSDQAKRLGQTGRTQKPKPWRIVWFAHPSLRILPANQTPDSSHVNGGYTYPCNPSTIVIYRKEEVCRVLVHELLHAACTDDMRKSEEEREVLTETWAELFLIGVCARGSVRKAAALWKLQSQLIVDQEHALQPTVRSPADYAWRYTVGRRAALATLGIPLPAPSYTPVTSLRFTVEELLP